MWCHGIWMTFMSSSDLHEFLNFSDFYFSTTQVRAAACGETKGIATVHRHLNLFSNTLKIKNFRRKNKSKWHMKTAQNLHEIWVFMAVNIQVRVFQDMMPYSVVHRHQHFGRTCCCHLQGRRWKTQVPPKCWYISTKLYGVTFQNMVILKDIFQSNGTEERLLASFKTASVPQC